MPKTQAGERVTAGLLSSGWSLGDASTHTVTQATANPLSSSYPTDGGESAGITYRLTSYGTGTWGSTSQQLNYFYYLAGSSVSSAGLASGTFATSQSIDWRAVYELTVVTTGSSGTCNICFSAQVTANIVAAADQGQSMVRTDTAVAFDTTTSNSMQLQADWASTTGAPTITSVGTIFEKLGGG